MTTYTVLLQEQKPFYIIALQNEMCVKAPLPIGIIGAIIPMGGIPMNGGIIGCIGIPIPGIGIGGRGGMPYPGGTGGCAGIAPLVLGCLLEGPVSVSLSESTPSNTGTCKYRNQIEDNAIDKET